MWNMTIFAWELRLISLFLPCVTQNIHTRLPCGEFFYKIWRRTMKKLNWMCSKQIICAMFKIQDIFVLLGSSNFSKKLVERKTDVCWCFWHKEHLKCKFTLGCRSRNRVFEPQILPKNEQTNSRICGSKNFGTPWKYFLMFYFGLFD